MGVGVCVQNERHCDVNLVQSKECKRHDTGT